MKNFIGFLTESADSTPVKDVFSGDFFFAINLDKMYGEPFVIYDYGKSFLFRCPLDDFADVTYKKENVTAIEITLSRKGTVVNKTICTNVDDYSVNSLPPKLRGVFGDMARQLKPYVKSMIKVGVDSNFYKAIVKRCEPYGPWCDEEYKFRGKQPDSASADYMLKNGELPK